MSKRLRAQGYIFLFRSFYGSSSSRKENQTTYVALPTSQISEDELDSSDDSDFTIESETEEEIVLSKSAEEIDSENDSDNELTKKKEPSENVESITWKSGKSWTRPVQSPDVSKQKLEIYWNNNPKLKIYRFSNAIEFFQLFLTDELLDHIYCETQLYNTWQNVNTGSKKVKEVSREKIR